ncbi:MULTISPECIES: hypothetical protein [unclassified Duganella]|uniref:hypothetical protein n=1 Tax=unclassified Duganella TaxID=2636909 RepID=UPI00102931BC|nr:MULTISPECIES: hypothetical protein [unclassified Duganella]
MKTKPLVLVAAILATSAQAAPNLQPTLVSTNDCVATRITAEKTKIAFFTSRCSESDFFIALDGVTYTLRRIGAQPESGVWFVGRFEGEGVKVVISVTSRRVGRCDGLSLAEMRSSLIAGPHKVAVKIRRGADEARINGLYDDCP